MTTNLAFLFILALPGYLFMLVSGRVPKNGAELVFRTVLWALVLIVYTLTIIAPHWDSAVTGLLSFFVHPEPQQRLVMDQTLATEVASFTWLAAVVLGALVRWRAPFQRRLAARMTHGSRQRSLGGRFFTVANRLLYPVLSNKFWLIGVVLLLAGIGGHPFVHDLRVLLSSPHHLRSRNAHASFPYSLGTRLNALLFPTFRATAIPFLILAPGFGRVVRTQMLAGSPRT